MSDVLIKELRSQVDELQRKFETYGYGDRPQSPPVKLIRELREAERALFEAKELRHLAQAGTVPARARRAEELREGVSYDVQAIVVALNGLTDEVRNLVVAVNALRPDGRDEERLPWAVIDFVGFVRKAWGFSKVLRPSREVVVEVDPCGGARRQARVDWDTLESERSALEAYAREIVAQLRIDAQVEKSGG